MYIYVNQDPILILPISYLTLLNQDPILILPISKLALLYQDPIILHSTQPY